MNHMYSDHHYESTDTTPLQTPLLGPRATIAAPPAATAGVRMEHKSPNLVSRGSPKPSSFGATRSTTINTGSVSSGGVTQAALSPSVRQVAFYEPPEPVEMNTGVASGAIGSGPSHASLLRSSLVSTQAREHATASGAISSRPGARRRSFAQQAK
jgi:hypothetical protein